MFLMEICISQILMKKNVSIIIIKKIERNIMKHTSIALDLAYQNQYGLIFYLKRNPIGLYIWISLRLSAQSNTIQNINRIYWIKNSDSIYKEPKDITINQFLNSENSLYCQQDSITTPEIMQEAWTLENYINFSLINKADRNHIEISHNIIREMSSQLREKQIKNNINAQKQSILPIEINQRDFPADPYLVNWRSKYFIGNYI